MFNIIEVLFLIFGWVFHIKGLVIASLVVSAAFLILLILSDTMKWTEKKGSKPAMFIQIICLALSIIKLCIW